MREENKCIWNLGDPCDGEVKEALVFEDQLKVLICEHHLNGHKSIMMLHKNGYPIEEILNMSGGERNNLISALQLSGIELEK